MNNTIRIIIVDDHPVVQQGFAYMFQSIDRMEVLAHCATARQAFDFLEDNPVDVVLLDIHLPDKNGIEVCKELEQRYPRMKIIAISNSDEYSIIARMLDSGAAGYVLKSSDAEELIQCIDDALFGNIALSAEVKQILTNNRSTTIPIITRRELQVLTMLANGYNSVQIGEQIFISPATVETHRRNLLKKFNVVNVAALIHRANELSFI